MAQHPGVAWLVGGIACMAATLGFMIGASSSPIAGVAVTAASGIVAAAFGLLHQRQLNASRLPRTATRAEPPEAGLLVSPEGVIAHSNQLPTHIGQTLILFAACLLVGTFVGSYSRLAFAADRDESPRPFPWSESNPPQTAYEAVDWLATAERLRSLGYDDSQIARVYAIGAAEKINLLEAQRPPLSLLLLGVPPPDPKPKFMIAEGKDPNKTKGG